MQMGIVGAAVAGLDEMPKGDRTQVPNPLVNTYQTSDGRWIALCMLQPDVYWADFCMAIGRKDLIDDERFATGPVRAEHGAECVAELDKTFATKSLAEWKPLLATQPGQWDVVNRVSDMPVDPQALANRFVQTVDYGEGRELPLIANPVQFDREPPGAPTRARVRCRHGRDPAVTRLGLGRHPRSQGLRRRSSDQRGNLRIAR